MLNAVNERMSKELLDALRSAERDDEVHCLIITGSGRAFCAGEDIQDLRGQYERGGNPKLGERLLLKYNPIIRQIRRMQKPVIAAVNGVAAVRNLSNGSSDNANYAGRRASVLVCSIDFSSTVKLRRCPSNPGQTAGGEVEGTPRKTICSRD